jgi:polysaccharide pyruvyl transferase WcaK-like protein
LVGTTIYNVKKGISFAKNMDLVIFGGGPLMALNYLAEMIAIFEQAALYRVPTVMAGCGIGPLGRGFHNKAIKHLLELASFRIYRDQKSFDESTLFGIDTSRDQVAEDPAFTWLADKCAKQAKNMETSNTSTIKLILGIRSWPYLQYVPEFPLKKAKAIGYHFEQQLLKALEQLVSQHDNLKIIPYPMCTNHYGDDDRWFYRRLFKDSSSILTAALDYSVLSRELSPNEAFNIFRGADIALSMRFHSLVFALGIGLPVVAIDYTLGKGKVAALAQERSIPCCSLDSIDAEFIVLSLQAVLNSNAKQDGKKNIPVPIFPRSMLTALEVLSHRCSDK